MLLHAPPAVVAGMLGYTPGPAEVIAAEAGATWKHYAVGDHSRNRAPSCPVCLRLCPTPGDPREGLGFDVPGLGSSTDARLHSEQRCWSHGHINEQRLAGRE